MTVEEHLETINVHEVIITPGHEDRKESAEFRKAKERLKEDGHYKCWVCGSTKNLQVHHFFIEWSLAATGDFEKMKELAETFDIYGYGKLLKNKPITSPDDIRNMMVLDQDHHTGTDSTDNTPTGIHNMTFPAWIMQKLSKDGFDPIPQEGQTVEKVEEQIKKLEE